MAAAPPSMNTAAINDIFRKRSGRSCFDISFPTVTIHAPSQPQITLALNPIDVDLPNIAITTLLLSVASYSCFTESFKRIVTD